MPRSLAALPCGWKRRASYDRSVRRWRHLDAGGLFLEAQVRRLQYRRCQRVRTQAVPGRDRAHANARDLSKSVPDLTRTAVGARRPDRTDVSSVRWCTDVPTVARTLVSCFRGSQTKTGDVRENLVGRLDPDEGTGIVVVGRQVETDGILEGARAAMRPTPDLLVREHREPALDLVDPGAVRGREMQLEARVPQQPAVHQGGLVRAVVVKHQMDVQVGGNLACDAIEETAKLDGSKATMGFADDFARRDIEGGNSEVVPCRR